MNRLSTIDGRVVDDESLERSKPKSGILARRALSAGRGRVPPSYNAERSLSPPPKKFTGRVNRSVGSSAASRADAREEELDQPLAKPVLARGESGPDDASRDEASTIQIHSAASGRSRKYIERAASASRARSSSRESRESRDTFRIEPRPRYRDQPKRSKAFKFDEADSHTNAELDLAAPKESYSIQTGIPHNVSGLTATSPRNYQGSTAYLRRDVPPPPPPPVITPRSMTQPSPVVAFAPTVPITPDNARQTSVFHTPKSQLVKSLTSQLQEIRPPGAPSSTSPSHELTELGRKEQARQRLKDRMEDIDSRVKGRRSYQTSLHVLDGVPDQDQSKLIVPPLMDEDGVWRDPVSANNAAYLGSPVNAAGYDEGIVKSLQSRVEYYKTCLRSSEKKLDELIDSEKELQGMLERQREEYERQRRQDFEDHERKVKEVNRTMDTGLKEAKNAIDALESTIEKLNEASKEKDKCINELKSKLNLVEMELLERSTLHEERISSHQERVAVFEKQVRGYKTTISENDEKIASLEKKCNDLEQQVSQLTEQCSTAEASLKESRGTIDQKEELLTTTKKELEQEKADLIYNFEQYREDLEYKMSSTNVRMEAIAEEKDNLIESLNSKVKLLEGALSEKEEEVTQYEVWKEKQEELYIEWKERQEELNEEVRASADSKHEDLNEKIQTLAMSLTQKDREIANFQRLLDHEKKMKAAGDERIGALKHELGKAQQELTDERKKYEKQLKSASEEKMELKSAGDEQVGALKHELTKWQNDLMEEKRRNKEDEHNLKADTDEKILNLKAEAGEKILKIKKEAEGKISALKEELTRCQHELITERRRNEAQDYQKHKLAEERHAAKVIARALTPSDDKHTAKLIAKALSPRSASRSSSVAKTVKMKNSRRKEDPRLDPPGSPRSHFLYEDTKWSSSDEESSDSIFQFSD